MNIEQTNLLRKSSRQLIREWGIFNMPTKVDLSPSQAHALIELSEQELTATQLSELLILDVSTTSRMTDKLEKEGYIKLAKARDKRTRMLCLTTKGKAKVQAINALSNQLIASAFQYVNPDDQNKIFEGIKLYADALAKSRTIKNNIHIRTLRKDKILRNKIIDLISEVQQNEFGLSIDRSINDSILYAEDSYFHANKCNFWYAVDEKDKVVGCIGMKVINNKAVELKKCFVAKDYRGTGISHDLVNKLIGQAKKLGFESIYLGTVDYFKWAHKFYQKFGFEIIDSENLPKEFEICPVDSVFFKLTLNPE